jgi:hypothetical protein
VGSLLAKCSKCGNMIAKGTRCPECRYSENEEDQDEERQYELARQYQEDVHRHKKNYTTFMILMLLTGFFGLVTAVMWVMLIFRGRIIGPGFVFGPVGSFICLGLANLIVVILGYLTNVSKKLFPIEINCPVCGIRLDEVGLEDDGCPGCKNRLR